MIMPLAYFCGFSVMDSCATATNMAYFGNDGQRIMHAATCKKDQMVLRGKDQRFARELGKVGQLGKAWPTVFPLFLQNMSYHVSCLCCWACIM